MSDAGSLSPAKHALLQQALQRRREAARSARTIPRRPPDVPVPLSSTQLRMWFLAQWEPDAPTFNAARAIRLRGSLDRAALQRGLSSLVARHESLRTVVVPGPVPYQHVRDSFALELPVVATSEDALPGILRDLARQPFDLTADLMLRASLLELAPEDQVLLLRIHHFAADAHSDTILFAELSDLYAAYRDGREPDLPEPALQYADYALWQQSRLTGQTAQELVAYWRSQLDGVPAVLGLPTDRPRPSVQRHAGAHRLFALPRELADGLQALGREQGATFYMTTLALFATLLYLRVGNDDIVIGSPMANRNEVELQDVVGFFSNTVALRVKLGGNPTFRDVLARARDTALGALAHQELPFERVVEAVAPRRDPGYNPLFQVNFRAQAAERSRLSLPGLAAEQMHVDIGTSRFDLALELELGQDALTGYFEYDEDLLLPETVEGWVEDLRLLAEQVIAAPDTPVLAIKLPRRRSPAASGPRISRRR